MHGYAGFDPIAVGQPSAPHFEFQVQIIGFEGVDKLIAVAADQAFQVFVFVQRAVLLQVDEAIKTPDPSSGFPFFIGNEVGSPPYPRRDGNLELVSLP